MADDDVPRIQNQRTAAKMIGVSAQRLQAMQRDAAWWVPELRTEAGYDVCGVVRAQLTHAGEGVDDNELKRRKRIADTERCEYQREAEELKVWELRRQRDLNAGNILPADVYSEFVRELLGMIRSGLEELPYQLSRSCSPAQRAVVYVPPEKQKSERDAAPLQKGIRKLIHDIEEWLNQDPTEETS